MKSIVLTTREDSERAVNVSVFLCNNSVEAKHFCHFVNRLPLDGEEKLVARRITTNVEYSLEKYQPFKFDDFVKLNDRTIQILMRETDSQMLAVALIDAKKEVKDCFFRNMSERSAYMLEEDIAYWGPVYESDIENARQVILDIYDDITGENRFDEAWARYKNIKEKDTKNKEDFDVENHIVLAFRGAENTADFVSVYLFDDYNSADDFCYYLNSLEPEKGTFLYAKYAGQMTEYETTKPALVSFNQVFEYIRRYGGWIIKEALIKFDSNTIFKALKGIDKHSRTLFMQNLSVKITDEINELIENSNNKYFDFSYLRETRQAQQRLLKSINKTVDKIKQGKYGKEIIKD